MDAVLRYTRPFGDLPQMRNIALTIGNAGDRASAPGVHHRACGCGPDQCGARTHQNVYCRLEWKNETGDATSPRCVIICSKTCVLSCRKAAVPCCGAPNFDYFWVEHPPTLSYKGQVIPAGSPKPLDGSDLDAYVATYNQRHEQISFCCGIVPDDAPLVKPGTLGKC